MNLGAELYRIGESKRYRVHADYCLSADCFDPCVLTDVDRKRDIACCRTRAVNGCPLGPTMTTQIASARAAQGWRVA